MKDSRANRRIRPPKKRRARAIAATLREKITSGLLKLRSDEGVVVMALLCLVARRGHLRHAGIENRFRRPYRETRDCSGGCAAAPWKSGLGGIGPGLIQRQPGVPAR